MRLVRDAIKAGFRFNGRDNLVRVSKFSRNSGKGQHGNHPKYTEQIKKMIKKTPNNSSPQEAADALRTFANKIKKIIEENPNTKINDLQLKQATIVNQKKKK